jgi:hypothetical protein
MALLGILMLLAGCIQPIQPPAAGAPATVTTPAEQEDDKIANAMSAGPASIAQDAAQPSLTGPSTPL